MEKETWYGISDGKYREECMLKDMKSNQLQEIWEGIICREIVEQLNQGRFEKEPVIAGMIQNHLQNICNGTMEEMRTMGSEIG